MIRSFSYFLKYQVFCIGRLVVINKRTLHCLLNSYLEFYRGNSPKLRVFLLNNRFWQIEIQHKALKQWGRSLSFSQVNKRTRKKLINFSTACFQLIRIVPTYHKSYALYFHLFSYDFICCHWLWLLSYDQGFNVNLLFLFVRTKKEGCFGCVEPNWLYNIAVNSSYIKPKDW